MVKRPKPSEPWYMPGRYRVNPVNFTEEVRSLYDFPATVVIHDNTIQKMDLSPGAKIYSPEEKVEVARLLDEVGVPELDVAPITFVGTPRAQSAVDGVRAICKAGLKMHVRVKIGIDYPKFIKGDFSYIDEAADDGVDGIDLSLAGRQSAAFMEAVTSGEQIDKVVSENLEHVRRKGLDAGVSQFVENLDYVQRKGFDTGKLGLDSFVQCVNRWLDHGVERVCMADGMSEVTPDGARYLIRYLRKGFKREIPIVYHPHNRFGLATAAAIAVASAGGWPETVLNGFADNGFASFDEVVLALETLYGVDTGIKVERLQELSREFERITGLKNHPFKPIAGEAMWAPCIAFQYSELVEGRPSMDCYFSPFEPGVVGANPNWMWSFNLVTPENVKIKLDGLGLSHNPDDVKVVVTSLTEKLAAMDKFPVWLSDSQVEEVCRRCLSGGKR